MPYDFDDYGPFEQRPTGGAGLTLFVIAILVIVVLLVVTW